MSENDLTPVTEELDDNPDDPDILEGEADLQLEATEASDNEINKDASNLQLEATENEVNEDASNLQPEATEVPDNDDAFAGGSKRTYSHSEKSSKGKRKVKQKSQRWNSFENLQDRLDPEEENLKKLEDCCDVTNQKTVEGYEADDTRKEMSSKWFSQIKLTPTQQQHLCFSESMLIMEENGTVVGKMYCSITPSKWENKKCLCVHSGSFGKFSNGLESGTSITGFIDFKLRPIQEFAHEWATLNSETIERKTFLLLEGGTMSVRITSTKNGNKEEKKSINLGVQDRENLVTEAVNILLQRHLILERRTNASMLVQSLAYTGEVLRTKYSELGVGWENVRGTQVKTWGIRRVVENEDEHRQWDSLFNKYARLVLRCQPDYPQALIPLWFENVADFDKRGNFIGINSPYNWSCDAGLYSKYKMKKEEITYDYRRYIVDNPEVQAMLSDYLQSVLFRKPQDVMEYTKQYFEAFLNMGGKNVKQGQKTDGATDMSSSYAYDYTKGSSGNVEEEDGDDDGDDDGAFSAAGGSQYDDGDDDIDDGYGDGSAKDELLED